MIMNKLSQNTPRYWNYANGIPTYTIQGTTKNLSTKHRWGSRKTIHNKMNILCLDPRLFSPSSFWFKLRKLFNHGWSVATKEEWTIERLLKRITMCISKKWQLCNTGEIKVSHDHTAMTSCSISLLIYGDFNNALVEWLQVRTITFDDYTCIYICEVFESSFTWLILDTSEILTSSLL